MGVSEGRDGGQFSPDLKSKTRMGSFSILGRNREPVHWLETINRLGTVCDGEHSFNSAAFTLLREAARPQYLSVF